MNCMKCGREISEDRAFCNLCLEEMSRYPVKPGIAIQLPRRKESIVPKKLHSRRRQPPTPEEQLLRLKKRMKHLVILWLITLLLLAATIYPTVEFFTGKTLLLPGQNYTAITENSSDTP